MTKTYSAYDARTRFGEILNLAYYQGVEIIVERMGKPMVKIIKADDKKTASKELIAKYRGIWNNPLGEKISKRAADFRTSFKIMP